MDSNTYTVGVGVGVGCQAYVTSQPTAHSESIICRTLGMDSSFSISTIKAPAKHKNWRKNHQTSKDVGGILSGLFSFLANYSQKGIQRCRFFLSSAFSLPSQFGCSWVWNLDSNSAIGRASVAFSGTKQMQKVSQQIGWANVLSPPYSGVKSQLSNLEQWSISSHGWVGGWEG